MESLAEAIGEVAIIGLEGVGEGVALGFEDDADALVVVEHLIDSGGGAVGRDEKGADWWFDRLLVGFLVLIVFVELAMVFFHFQLVELLEVVVNGLDEIAAGGEAAFASGGWGRDEGEEVGEDLAFGIDA